jgi:hypothetical protein
VKKILNSKKYKIGAIVFTLFLIGSFLTLPMSGAVTKNEAIENSSIIKNNGLSKLTLYSPESTHPDNPILLDNYYQSEEEISFVGEQNDIGYNTDAGDKIQRAMYIYVGEPLEERTPGRGRTGSLNSAEDDEEDWYRFSVSKGQIIQASVSSGFNVELSDTKGHPVSGIPYTALETGNHFLRIIGNDGDYTISISLSGQNDADSGNDAGNDINQATSIIPGSYTGYMDYNDQEDWYSFDVTSGQGIFITLDPLEKSDYDIHLYNPSGELVHSALYYGEDELEYPADVSGLWKIKLDMFPGWDTSKWPEDYFLYGSGAYELSLSIGGTAEAPPGPIPQPTIYPVAQTFKIANDPNSNSDEYDFLAAVPAAVFTDDGKQYVSPVVYDNDNTPTSWFGTADDTTQYLVDDWNTYLARHGQTAVEHKIDGDPIKAAANIATTCWTSSDTAVLSIDGSPYTDSVITNIDEDATLNVETKKTVVTPEELTDFAGYNSVQMWIGKEWGAMTLYAHGSNCPGIGLITPRYESGTYEDWPHPYDVPGDNTNIYFPISMPGLYWPYVDGTSGFDTFEITRYSADRYKIPISSTDSSIKVTVTTNEPSYLKVFLVDPYGSVRRPNVPHWNGGKINPIHQWNGDHHNGFEDWRRWEPTLSTEHTVEINYPMKGKWTVIVTPHYPYGEEKSSDTIPYHIRAEVREHNANRINAGLSAANAAVLASIQHAPLLYVTENEVPYETQNALNKLGVKNILFVNLNKVSKVQPIGTITEITSIQDVISKTKTLKQSIPVTSQNTEGNVITVTSFGTEDGFFAPAGLTAAYHASNVLSIGDVPDAYNTLDRATAWREYDGGWYHGCRAQGHLYKMNEPIDIIQIIKGVFQGEFPPLGVDQHIRWWGSINDEIYDWADNLDLLGDGQEVYLFVAPRDSDIRHPIIRVLTGIESYAGQFPFEIPSLDAALISRNILYPAIIYSNPGRDITTSQLMNFPDGWTWNTNDGERHTVYSTREFKETFSSHGRFYEGHVIFDNWLERMNNGVAINYYSGHGTGGSGVSAQYKNVEEQFPYAELTHEELHDFDWWDSWRGYHYDDEQTKTPRWGGFTWYNAQEPNLYDIIHFKWLDQLLGNTHSEIELWMSCTTGQHFGPEIYLEHGSSLWFGNAGTGLCPQADLLDDAWMKDMMVHGLNCGEAFSKYVWLHQRDFTAKYGSMDEYTQSLYEYSSLTVTNVQVFYGDPTITCYSPDWIEPIPVSP